jgi:hypothetical protein
MISSYWRIALSCYHCARPAGFVIHDPAGVREWRYQAVQGETRPAIGERGRPVCGACRGPLYQGEVERIVPIEPLEPEAPRKRGRPRKHPLPVQMPQARAS